MTRDPLDELLRATAKAEIFFWLREQRHRHDLAEKLARQLTTATREQELRTLLVGQDAMGRWDREHALAAKPEDRGLSEHPPASRSVSAGSVGLGSPWAWTSRVQESAAAARAAAEFAKRSNDPSTGELTS